MLAVEPFLTTPEIERIFSAGQRVQRMLDFEAALARAQRDAGLMPADACAAIVTCCRAERFDSDVLVTASRESGNSAIPMVKALSLAASLELGAANGWVHWGATSQDVLDTALILQVKEACELIVAQLALAESRIAKLAAQHLRTPMVGRTLLQQATAITLGYKLAIWGHAIERARRGVSKLQEDAFALQLGGAVGTLSVMGVHATAIQKSTAANLGLKTPSATWHVVRDRLCSIGAAMANVVMACAKMSQDLMLMMQSEVGEATESATSAGGSSAMPNKRNPVRALVPVAAAANVGGLLAGLYACALHDHERAAGNWHGEWLALPQLVALAHASASATADIAHSTTFSPDRMAQHLASGGGVIAAEALTAAMAHALGKDAARLAVERFCEEVRAGGGTLSERLAAAPEFSRGLSPDVLAAVFGHADAIDAAARAAQAWLDQRAA